MSQQQTVNDAMNDNPTTVSSDATVMDAARAMRDDDVSIVAVMDDDDTLIGVITDRDIAITIVAEGGDAGASVTEAMSDRPVSVGEDDSLDQAFQRMLQENVHRAPVTDDSGHVSGMLSQSDAATSGEGRSVGGAT